MTTTKAVMFAALAALAVGVCAAMADGPDRAMPGYQSARTLAAVWKAFGTIHRDADQLESSSPEVDSRQPGIFAQ
jgi:hypothetical protein